MKDYHRDNSTWLRRHKITRAEWDTKLAVQDGHCKICSRTTDLVVDHDHTFEPGQLDYFRGILCRQHNVGLGMFRDSEAELLLALDYLRGH